MDGTGMTGPQRWCLSRCDVVGPTVMLVHQQVAKVAGCGASGFASISELV